jgi:preprotein translocase subunit YajC
MVKQTVVVFIVVVVLILVVLVFICCKKQRNNGLETQNINVVEVQQTNIQEQS